MPETPRAEPVSPLRNFLREQAFLVAALVFALVLVAQFSIGAVVVLDDPMAGTILSLIPGAIVAALAFFAVKRL